MPKQLSTLDLNGNLTLTGLSGTSGQVLTSGGAGVTPTWTTISGGGGGVSLSTANTWSNTQTFTPTSVSTSPAIIKGLVSQTANLLEFQDSAGTVLSRFSSNGALAWSTYTASQLNSGNGSLTAITVNSGVTPITAQGTSGQTANLLSVQNSSGTTVSGTNANGQIYTGSTTTLRTTTVATTAASASSATVATYTVGTVSTVNPYAVGQLATTTGFTAETYFNGTFAITAIGGSSGAWTFTVVGSGFTVASATVQGTVSIPVQSSITASSAGTTGLVVKGTTSQTANLQEWQNSAGVIQASIGSSGALYVNNDSTLLGLLNVGSSALAGYQMTVTCFPSLATRVGALIKGGASQTADLAQYQTSTGTILGGRNGVGQTYTGSTTPILTAVGGTIQSIATGANPLVTMASAHGLTVGDLVTLAGTTGSTYNGTFVVATVPLTTTFTITSALTTGQASAAGTVSVPAQLSVTPKSVGTIPVLVKGLLSQTTNLQEWQDSTSTVVARVGNNGDIQSNNNIYTNGLIVNNTATILGGNSSTPSNGRFGFINQLLNSTSATTLVVKAPTSGIQDALVVVNNSYSPIFQVSNSGKIYNSDPTVVPLRVIAAPTAAVSITAISGSGTVVTYTVAGSTNPFVVGQTVTITGATTTAYNLVGATIASVTNTTFTVTNSATGATSTASAVSTSTQGNLQEWQNSAGAVLAKIDSAGAITAISAAGTVSTAATGAGYMGLPQNATTTGSYTVVAADAGKHIYASATRTVTIDSNTNLALPIGTTLTFIAGTGATMTIAITTDTMYLAGAGTTGSRTLAAFGMATAVKITSTSWMISGNGLT